MSNLLSAEALAAKVRAHRPDPQCESECFDCGCPWPCTAYDLLGHIAALDAELDEWKKMYREVRYAMENQELRIKQQDAEIAALKTYNARQQLDAIKGSL